MRIETENKKSEHRTTDIVVVFSSNSIFFSFFFSNIQTYAIMKKYKIVANGNSF